MNRLALTLADGTEVVAQSITRKSAAMHEAGHAVADMALGKRIVERVWIVRTRDGWRGACWSRGGGTAGEGVMKAMAGPIAEGRWWERSRARVQSMASTMAEVCLTQEFESGHDLARVRRLLERYCRDHTPHQTFLKFWARTEDLLAHQWPAVVGIAGLLVTRGSLSERETLEAWERFRRPLK